MSLSVRLAGLRARLVLLVLLGFVPVAVLTTYMVWEQQRAAADAAQEEALRLARLATSRYAQLTDSAAQLLAMAARLPEITAARTPECGALFARLLDRYRGYVSLGLIDSRGNIRCDARSGGVGAPSTDPALTMHALRTRSFVLGNYYVDPGSGRPTVHAVFPVIAEDNSARAVVYAALDLAWFNALAAEALLPPGATLTVVNRHGVMLAQFPPPDAATGRSAHSDPIVDAVLGMGGEGTTKTEGADGVRRLYGFTPLRGSLDPAHAFIAVGIPETVAYASVSNLLRTAVVGALLVSIIAWLAIWKGADALVLRNVQALVQAARRLAAGELDARAGIARGAGEITQLARTFDEMAATLQTRATESLVSQAALQHSEARFRRLAENARDVIYRFRLVPERGFEYVSPAAGALTGYTPEEFYADPDLSRKLVHPEDWPIAQALLRGEGVRPEPLELRWLRRDGSVIWTEQRNVLVYDDTGSLVEVEGIVRDITERKRALEELRLLQTITVAVGAAADLDGALRIVLQRVCEATGWVLGQAWVPMPDGQALVCSRAWYTRASGLEGFRAFSQDLIVRGDGGGSGGLLSRTLRAREPVWLRDVTLEPAFLRGPQAKQAGLKAAMAVPVMAGPDLEAIIEFFMLAPRPEDADLVRTVSGVAAQLGSVIRHKRSEAQLSYLAHHDLLTDLPNRALFNDRLRQAMLEADRYGRLVAVAFLDLDRFKTINDSLGHETGDLLLKSVAQRLRACVRAVDTVARISGDEFTLVLPDLGHVDDAARVTQKIVDNFHRPFHVAGLELYVTASIGLTLYPVDETDARGLLRNADVAMYRAKEKGRNTYEMYVAEMTARVQEQLSLEGALRRALERKEFMLEYQPLVDARAERIVGAEALLRWNHPERGIIPPAQFIPLAEETGLIVPIGAWVLAHACAQGAAWRSRGYDYLRLSVNISARQFQQPGLMDLIAATMRDTGFDPARLDLEITESLLVHNVEAALATMEALNQLGVRLSIDDFGTGYSSLGYLKRFPIDRLKIDRSFVKDIPGDPDDAAIAAAIIAMAHRLGIQVIAEGVETTEQLAFLRAHGCHDMQGEYFSRPLSSEEFTRLLGERRPLPFALAGYHTRRKHLTRGE